jgi:hypothetical protein
VKYLTVDELMGSAGGFMFFRLQKDSRQEK